MFSVAVTAITQNFNMIPTVVLLGSFLVPVTGVLWYLDHYEKRALSDREVLNAFLVGGVLGVLGASLLESWLLTGGPLVYVGVGLIEEGAKLVALIVVARRVLHHDVRDGVVLGAAVGFGFAALESSGYALTALFASASSSGHLSLRALVETELVRGVLAPVGHGVWTAILGGALFREAHDGRPRVTRAVLLTYLGVSLLHAAWDSMQGLALIITSVVTAAPVRAVTTAQGTMLVPTSQQVHVFTLVEVAGFLVLAAVAVAWAHRVWKRSAGGSGGSAPPAAPVARPDSRFEVR